MGANRAKTPLNPVWYSDAAALMARLNCSLKQAVGELGVDLTTEEAEHVFRRREFQEIYLIEVNKYRAELADNPGANKAALIGLSYICIEALVKQGDYEKALNGIEKLAKLRGWIGAESNISIFAGLTARDIAEARARIASNIDESAGSTGSKPVSRVDSSNIRGGNA